MTNRRIFIVLSLAAALAGCKTTGAATRTEYVEVLREVPKPCPGKRPARPAPLGVMPTDLAQLAAILGAKLAEYSAPGQYADQAEAIFDRCPLEPPAPAQPQE